MSDERDRSVEERLTRLEESLSALTSELSGLRSEFRNAAPPAAAPPPPPTRERRRPGVSLHPALRRIEASDVEGLLGRYGMLGIAVLAAVAAVGTFLSWAVTHGYLVLLPAERVGLGMLFAAGIAVWGVKLRRTERSFGSSMLGLALVIALVCAYAAGPSFELVPTWVAFAGAAFASWALAIFAHAENDEPLWCVGFGGAAMAPFVTSDGHGSVYALAIYGALVLLPACFAISHHDWPVGWRVFYLVSGLFAVGAAVQAHTVGLPGYLTALAFPFVVAGVGVVPFAPDARKRGALRWLAALSVLASIAAHGSSTAMTTFGSAAVFAAALWLFILDRNAEIPQSSIVDRGIIVSPPLDWVDAAALPLMLAAQAVNVLSSLQYCAMAAGTAALCLLIFATRRRVSPLRDAAAFGAIAASVGALEFVPMEMPVGRISAFLALGLASLAMHKLRPSRSWLFGGGAVLLAAAGMSITALVQRPIYQFTPFATEASLGALLVTIALTVVARFWYWVRVATRASIADRSEWMYASSLRQIVRGVTLAPWVWVFIWAMFELAMAFSPSTSTLLLVTYFAATAVGCVAVGRSRRSARLRQTGLGLALVAAATSVFGATSYFDFAARIAAYLVTSAFLLGIAYWYRRPGAAVETA